LTPLSVERSGQLGPYRFFERTALLLQPRDMSSTRCADKRCLWVLSWAKIAAPSGGRLAGTAEYIA
jgi:hypothetical protein